MGQGMEGSSLMVLKNSTVTVQDGCHRFGKHVIGQQVVDPVGLATIGRPYDHHGQSGLEWNDRLHSLHIHAQWSTC